MEKRFALFIAGAMLLVVLNYALQSWLLPPRKIAQVAKPKVIAKADGAKDAAQGADANKQAGKPHEPGKEGDQQAAEHAAGEKDSTAPGEGAKPAEGSARPDAQAEIEPPVEPRWITLGSADAADPYRMLVTLTNVGAAIERAELNSDRYRDLEDRSGYLGYLATADASNGAGSLLRSVVGAGTPAAAAGLKPGDIVRAIDGHAVGSAVEMEEILKNTTPGQTVKITLADGRSPTATLRRRPLQVLRPELDSKGLDVVGASHDPLSMLLTFDRIGDRRLPEKAESDEELRGVDLRGGAWRVESADQSKAVFVKRLPGTGLEVRKRYQLAKVVADLGPEQPAYHLDFDIELRNSGAAATAVVYRLEGPTGVVLEGRWYGSKISRAWFASAGLRDVIGKFKNGGPEEVTTNTVATDKSSAWPTKPLQYVSVDAQYFTTALIPAGAEEDLENDFLEVKPIRVGSVPKDAANHKLTDVSFRLTSRSLDLKPGDEPLRHAFTLFLGPRQPALLANYGPPGAKLGGLIYYGWFDWVAEPMLMLLHGFYRIVHNYGVAIVMLTVLVRGCMFPLSRKQAISAQKMQEIQPEIKAVQEKYKKQPELLRKAQQDLYRKHNFNPFGGCLMAFIQLPIFMGLYRSLAVDVELRQAPLLSDTIRWCSNLAAPDMLWDWSPWVPAWVSEGNGMLGLGPYLNVFPLVTIALFLWQQKMFMPPATDEQTAMQQKIMQYMMIFMGVMFFKVPSGLCLYFIASSTWGIAERKLLHPPKPPAGGSHPVAASSPTAPTVDNSNRNGDAKRKAGKSKQRGRK